MHARTYQKGTEARDSEWQWHQLGHMQVCASLQTLQKIKTSKTKHKSIKKLNSLNMVLEAKSLYTTAKIILRLDTWCMYQVAMVHGMPSSSVGKVFGHQWLSRWLKFRRSRVSVASEGKDWKVERLTSCSRGARLSRDKQLTEVVSL